MIFYESTAYKTSRILENISTGAFKLVPHCGACCGNRKAYVKVCIQYFTPYKIL